jgi:hypothetical protein
MMKTGFFLASALLGLSSCSPDAVETSDVVQLTLCPEQSPAPCSVQPAADGHSAVTVQVCAQTDSVSARDRRTDLNVELHATRGVWLDHDAADPASVSVPLGSSSCRFATLTTNQAPGAIEIDATLLGYTASAHILTVPAQIENVDFAAANTPALQGAEAATVQFTVTARAAAGGLPSAGSRVKFSVDKVLPGGSIAISPLNAVLDATGSAEVSLFVPSAVKQFTVHASATAPDHSELGVAPLGPVLGEFIVVRQE